MEAHATKQQQEPNNDKTTSWKKIPYGLVRENTSGVTLFTLLFRGIGINFNRPFFRFCTFSLYYIYLYICVCTVDVIYTGFYTKITQQQHSMHIRTKN